MDFGKMEVEYFCGEDWTGEIRLRLLRKIVLLAQQILIRYILQTERMWLKVEFIYRRGLPR
jgi:hypothetical protein